MTMMILMMTTIKTTTTSSFLLRAYVNDAHALRCVSAAAPPSIRLQSRRQ
jgi:hypothetical protein